VALAQCAAFLRTHPGWNPVEALDTAGAVRALAEGRLAADAVIGSRRAAERYGCRVLREAIQDEAANFTTFVVLERRYR
jgi:prephenate dehydratase